MNCNIPLLIDVDFPERLCARLKQPLPGRTAQRQFAHELSYGRHFWTQSHGAIPAATVVVLVRRNGVWQIPLTLRPPTLTAHAGQICLPGGRVDDGESLSQAAVREVEEELRIPRSTLQMLGRLSPLFLYVSNFHVTPFVAVCAEEDCEIAPNPAEVADLIWLPVAELVDPGIRGTQRKSGNAGVSIDFVAPHFDVRGHLVWGATAMMLSEFAAIIDPRLVVARSTGI